MAPDAPDDEDLSLGGANLRIARAAAEGVTGIDAVMLLAEPGRTATNALPHQYVKTRKLIYSNYIIGVNGRTVDG